MTCSNTLTSKLAAFVLAGFFLFALSVPAKAQGTFDCFQGESATGAPGWVVSADRCSADGVPDVSSCPAACEQDFDCQTAGGPPRGVNNVACKPSHTITIVPWGGACNSADSTRVCDPSSPYDLSCQDNLCLISPAAARLELGAECRSSRECAGGPGDVQCLSTGAGGKKVCSDTSIVAPDSIPEGGTCAEDYECADDLECIDNVCGNRPEEAEEGEKLGEFSYCNQVPDGEQRTACNECIGQGGADDGGPKNTVYTAVGCINTSGSQLAGDLIRLFLGVSGGIALLSILAASFLLSTSRGDTNKVKSAKDLMTAAVSGLFFIIFSVIILNFIGVEILKIPGLG